MFASATASTTVEFREGRKGSKLLTTLVGAGRFERPTPCAQGRCATRLRYAPTFDASLILNHWRNFRYWGRPNRVKMVPTRVETRRQRIGIQDAPKRKRRSGSAADNFDLVEEYLGEQRKLGSSDQSGCGTPAQVK